MSDKQTSETKGRRVFHEPAKEVEGQRLQWQAEGEPSEASEASEEAIAESEVEGQGFYRGGVQVEDPEGRR